MKKESLMEYKAKLQRVQQVYQSRLAESKHNLEMIKGGCVFGYYDHADYWGHYFPLTLIEIIDEEQCLIKVIEPGNPNHPEEEVIDTFDLYIENPPHKKPV